MQDNPYAALAGAMRQAGREGRPAVYRFGTVTALVPLTVQAGDLLLTGGDLLVNAGLLPRTRPVTLNGTAALSDLTGSLTGTDNEGSVDLIVTAGGLSGNGTVTGTLAEQAGSLTVGDRVVLLTADDQLHVVLCKVVEA